MRESGSTLCTFSSSARPCASSGHRSTPARRAAVSGARAPIPQGARGVRDRAALGRRVRAQGSGAGTVLVEEAADGRELLGDLAHEAVRDGPAKALDHGEVLGGVVGVEREARLSELEEDAPERPEVARVRPLEPEDDLGRAVVPRLDHLVRGEGRGVSD
jgi:hypothetical protein